MPDFTNLDLLFGDYLIKVFKEVLEEVLEKINDKLRAHIEYDVYINRNNYYAYGSSTPTYEFLESVSNSEVTQKGNELSGMVFHDKDKMTLDINSFVHGSKYWSGGEDIRDILPQIINDGLSGNFFGEGWWQEPRPYWDNTIKELESKGLVKSWFKEGLAKRGIQSV